MTTIYAVMNTSNNMIVNAYNLPFVPGSNNMPTDVQYTPSQITFGSNVQLIQVSASAVQIGSVVQNPTVVITATPATPSAI